MMTVYVDPPEVEHHDTGLGIGETSPRLSWVTFADPDWVQAGYSIRVIRNGVTRSYAVDSKGSVLVPWPTTPLTAREAVTVAVRVTGDDDTQGGWSAALVLEAGLLKPSDWSAQPIASAWEEDPGTERTPPVFRGDFQVKPGLVSARLYVSAHGLYEMEINGFRIGREALAPGWTAYDTRVRYTTYDIADALIPGTNVAAAWMGDGWYRGRFGFEGGHRNIYGTEISLLAQIETTYNDGTRQITGTGPGWTAARGPIVTSNLYDGETYDARREIEEFSQVSTAEPGPWTPAKTVEWDLSTLVAPDGPPVRNTEEIRPVNTTRTSAGTYILDFGQNFSGRLRITVDGPRGHRVQLHHAEILRDGELETTPLRHAAAADTYILKGNGPETWEPRFTVHGFRYAEVSNWPTSLAPDAIVARVYHTDFPRTGWFECSDARINRLHENVRWSMRGNMVDLPTDCPQRDERLGWTGDIQVFAPTASFLYDCSGLLTSWLKDLAAEQLPDGTVPWYVPVIPGGEMWTPVRPGAAWGDAAALVPWAMWQSFEDLAVLGRQFDSARAWVDLVDRLSVDHLWDSGFQLGDWLDPAAPPEDPASGRTDRFLIATAYAYISTRRTADMADLLGRTGDAAELHERADRIAQAFRAAYVTGGHRLTSDAPTAYAVAIAFDLLDPAERDSAGRRLAELVAKADFAIPTGFVGTPLICGALTATGQTATAYRMLTNEQCPSWLYAVTMGATTIWERWDGLLPDGSLNPGEMTSFNHYALGAVAEWLHTTVAGLAPAAPGYRQILFAPQPGGGLTSASASHITPYGTASIAWTLVNTQFSVAMTVPTGTTAVFHTPNGMRHPLTSGTHHYRIHLDKEIPGGPRANR